MPSRFDHTRAELTELLRGEPRYRVDQVWRGLYEQFAGPEEMTNLPKALRDALVTALPSALAPVVERVSDKGDTVKLLWQLDGGGRIETVLMLYPGRATVCVSSQAGCAMGCGFCATGQAGFARHLTTGEIVEQVVYTARRARELGRRLSNVVFMGMGEPLANEEAVWGAIERIQGDIGISARNITVSTVGLVPGIRRLAERPLPVNLAVSLHAANDALRDELVPINRRHPIAELLAACWHYLERQNGRNITFEYTMLDGVNDRPEQARELAALLAGREAKVNLIPFNTFPGTRYRRSPPAVIAAFRDTLLKHGVIATIRRTRGDDIDAACGQLVGRVRDRMQVRLGQKLVGLTVQS